MQISGIGSSHSASDHHVTRCLHDHHELSDTTGGMAMKASASMEASAAQTELQQEGLLSLSAWLKNMLGSGKGHLLNFWDGGTASAGGAEGDPKAGNSVEGDQAAVPQTAVHTGDTAMAAAATVQPRMDQYDPHLPTAGGTGTRKQMFLQRIRERFRSGSEQSKGRRTRKDLGFHTKNSFQARQEKPTEDLRKHSRSSRDTVEIDYARTEESYLMDSYDRKGEYSMLTTKK